MKKDTNTAGAHRLPSADPAARETGNRIEPVCTHSRPFAEMPAREPENGAGNACHCNQPLVEPAGGAPENGIDSACALALLREQLTGWNMARTNYEALNRVKIKEFPCPGGRLTVQFNPTRIRSSAACIDAAALRERSCFLCPPQVPPQQRQLPFGKRYWLMVNPFPIFPQHFTLPAREHVPQRIAGRYGELLDMAASLEGFVLFYNGPKCGASAPDHMHFQAGNNGFLPVQQAWREAATPLAVPGETARLYAFSAGPRKAVVIETGDKAASEAWFHRLYRLLPLLPGDDEPMLNLLAWRESGRWITMLFPRAKHRPSCYDAPGEANLLYSPASVDMGGVSVLPRESDFEKVTAAALEKALNEVCFPAAAWEALLNRLTESR
ncbi:MAG: DUF4922 domain-containing protein [Parabacteroides sp.]|nr:DUF4922 domain-containing protein [Parabacteroides sp.]